MKPLSELSGKHSGATLFVIGRGPSLAHLRAEHIAGGVVMAINQTIDIVEAIAPDNSLYSLQKDHLYRIPRRARLLLHEREAWREIGGAVEYGNVSTFDAERDLSLPWNVPSVVIAAALGKYMGCKEVVFLCCDAVTDGITEAHGEPATRPGDYLLHGLMVRRHATLPVEWRRIG